MISQIAGTLVHRELDRVEIMTAGGVAYECHIPLSVFETLPAEGKPAPELLLFAGLGPSLAASRVWQGVEASAPWDVFALNGCQE